MDDIIDDPMMGVKSQNEVDTNLVTEVVMVHQLLNLDNVITTDENGKAVDGFGNPIVVTAKDLAILDTNQSNTTGPNIEGPFEVLMDAVNSDDKEETESFIKETLTSLQDTYKDTQNLTQILDTAMSAAGLIGHEEVQTTLTDDHDNEMSLKEDAIIPPETESLLKNLEEHNNKPVEPDDTQLVTKEKGKRCMVI